MSNAKPTIKVQDVLAFLKKGYTRYAKDDEGHGSIQAHYNLSGVEVKELFQHPKLKARKTILPKASLNIIDEEEDIVETVTEETVSEVETEPAEPTPSGTSIRTSDEVMIELGIMGKPDAEPVVEDETISKDELFS